MTTLGRAAILPLLLVAFPTLAETTPAPEFPMGVWAPDVKSCRAFILGQGSDAFEVTGREIRRRGVEGQLTSEEMVSVKKLENGHFRIEVRPFPNDPTVQQEEFWTEDGGVSILAKSSIEDPKAPPRKAFNCQTVKKAPVASPSPASFGKWKVDLNPESPRAVLDGEGGFPRMTVSCTSRDALGYQFQMADGKAPRFITLPAESGDTNLGIDPSGFMPPKNAARFVGAMADLFKQGQIDGSREPESAMSTSIGVNGRLSDIVPIGGLMAVREALRPLCASARPTIVPTAPSAALPTAAAGSSSPGNGRVTLQCSVSGRNSTNRWLIYVSIDPSRGAYAIMNANRGVSGRAGIFGIDSAAYRLQTPHPMGLLTINRGTGELVQYNVSQLMGPDNQGFCSVFSEYIPF